MTTTATPPPDLRAALARAAAKVTNGELLLVVTWILEREAAGELTTKPFRRSMGRGVEVGELRGAAICAACDASTAILSLLGLRAPLRGLTFTESGLP